MIVRSLQVMDFDIKTNVNQFEMTKELLQNGWRLPTNEELNMIFISRKENPKINLENTWYLADLDSPNKKAFPSDLPYGIYTYQFDFSTGEEGYMDCTEEHWGLCNVRLVRDEITVSNIKVKAIDFGEMSWSEANAMIKKYLGTEWRLPTIKELNLLYGASEFCRNEFDLNFSKDKYYWAEDFDQSLEGNSENQKAALFISQHEPDSMAGYYRNFDSTEKYRVKPVKSI